MEAMLKRKLTCSKLMVWPTKETYMIIHVMEAQKLAELGDKSNLVVIERVGLPNSETGKHN